MKFQVQFKDPDVVDDAIRDALDSQLAAMSELDEEERGALFDVRYGKVKDFTDAWIEYGEYVTIEFDTEAGTAIVVKK